MNRETNKSMDSPSSSSSSSLLFSWPSISRSKKKQQQQRQQQEKPKSPTTSRIQKENTVNVRDDVTSVSFNSWACIDTDDKTTMLHTNRRSSDTVVEYQYHRPPKTRNRTSSNSNSNSNSAAAAGTTNTAGADDVSISISVSSWANINTDSNSLVAAADAGRARRLCESDSAINYYNGGDIVIHTPLLEAVPPPPPPPAVPPPPKPNAVNHGNRETSWGTMDVLSLLNIQEAREKAAKDLIREKKNKLNKISGKISSNTSIITGNHNARENRINGGRPCSSHSQAHLLNQVSSPSSYSLRQQHRGTDTPPPKTPTKTPVVTASSNSSGSPSPATGTVYHNNRRKGLPPIMTGKRDLVVAQPPPPPPPPNKSIGTSSPQQQDRSRHRFI